MNYALCLAGGKGTRMGNTGVPKQFIQINGKPIIIYTIEKLLSISLIDKIIVVCNPDYINYMKDLLLDYHIENVDITEGGSDRLSSTLNGLYYIRDSYGVSEDDIFIAHDSVRPFTDNRIFEENIKEAHKSKAATTVFDLSETIVEVNDDNQIYKLYPREKIFSGQSPQTFNIKYFLECTEKIPKELLPTFTDLSFNIVYVGGKVTPVMGDSNNIKITNPVDILIASSIINDK